MKTPKKPKPQTLGSLARKKAWDTRRIKQAMILDRSQHARDYGKT